MTPTLSILVPTKHRPQQLTELMQSLYVEGVTPRFEILVQDNSETRAIAKLNAQRTRAVFSDAWCRRAPSYVSNDGDVGFDENLRRLVARAQGTYCWFIGDDDVIHPGALRRVLDTIAQAPGAIILGDVVTMNQQGSDHRLSPTMHDSDFTIYTYDRAGDAHAFLQGAATIRASFPYLSNVVFPRAAWNAVEDDVSKDQHYHNGWKMFLNGTPIVYRKKALVYDRIGNERKSDEDMSRLVLHTVECARSVAALFGNAQDAQAMRDIWRLEYPPARVAELNQRLERTVTWPYTKQLLEGLFDGR